MPTVIVDRISQEMVDCFEQRTNRHVRLVGKYARRYAESLEPAAPLVAELLDRAARHDRSKFEHPERDAYVLLTWRFLQGQQQGQAPVDFPQRLKTSFRQAIYHHVTTNDHHPQFWHGRPRREGEPVDAYRMTEAALTEMCADWCAMSEELGNDPFEWAEKTLDLRFRFGSAQKRQIHRVLAVMWLEHSAT